MEVSEHDELPSSGAARSETSSSSASVSWNGSWRRTSWSLMVRLGEHDVCTLDRISPIFFFESCYLLGEDDLYVSDIDWITQNMLKTPFTCKTFRISNGLNNL